MNPDCLFCRVVADEFSADRVMETELSLAFRDIRPVAPEHVLIIPKIHVASLEGLDTGQTDGAAMWADLAAIARKLGSDYPNGWRLVTNVGDEGGQSVHHLHLHFLAGRQFSWPPG